jgi:hypothetical protein
MACHGEQRKSARHAAPMLFSTTISADDGPARRAFADGLRTGLRIGARVVLRQHNLDPLLGMQQHPGACPGIGQAAQPDFMWIRMRSATGLELALTSHAPVRRNENNRHGRHS